MKKKVLIGSVAQQTGLSAKTIRYYEKVHVLPRPVRRTSDNGNGYRVYDAASIRRMTFLAHARKMQFSVPELRRLSRVAANGCCGAIAPKLKTLLTEKIQAIEVQMAELTSLKQSLQGILVPAPTSQPSKASVMQAEDCSPSTCAETVLGKVGEAGWCSRRLSKALSTRVEAAANPTVRLKPVARMRPRQALNPS